jgi:poly-gamma-glutamate synthesis protein (capsule biosynthesis protein)
MLTFKDGIETFRESVGPEALDLLIAGDCCPRNQCESLVLEGKSSTIISDIKPILDDCDLSMVQFETPLSDRGTAIHKAGPHIKVSPKCVTFIKECGFDIAALANNHIGDYGPLPVLDTLQVLKDNAISYMGAGENLQSAREPLFINKNGLTLAFLNYAENEFGGATVTTAGASPLDPCVNITQIRQVSQQADITIVTVHGGNEYNPVPSPRMVKTYRSFADAGASAVINIHTHCPQGIELWNGCPIVYCPGNFYFDCHSESYTKTMWTIGYMVKFNIDKQGIFALSVFPYHIAFDGGKIHLFRGEKKARFLEYLAEISAIIKDEEKVDNMFNAWTAIHGRHLLPLYADFMTTDSFEKAPSEIPNSPNARNTLTCESHNELLTTQMKLYFDNRLHSAKEQVSYLKQLSDPYTQGLL